MSESSEHTLTPGQFSEWQAVRRELPQEQRNDLERLVEEGESRPATEVQSEFESFMSSLPPNFRTGLSKIVDVSNLTPEQLRGMLITNSIDGMDEIIRAAQYGDEKSAGLDRAAAASLSSNQHSAEFHHVSEERLGELSPSPIGVEVPARGRGGPDGPG